ncbi:cysteine synthase family protein [Alkaliphilus pronyensis]|uniref:Cysteine synthase family protein n=1 Tax=Alkaliphilus pronyensis TaxID=1482732 RepID=A0A6I0FIX2_9FIRM|nr:cysteine synthase family protein [Alkaliphilus pronyensis]KAB3536091.1 cysteine synthase family protein [Alkaliphilus pronyensis]
MIRNFDSSMLGVIGNTPLVELQRLTKNIEGSIYAKLEFFSPGLSKKDRVALQMIEDAESKGILKPGQTVVELTSGNMGTGLAIVCKLKGYKFVAVMSKGNSIERAKMMKAFRAEVVLVDQMPDSIKGQVSGKDLELVEVEAQRLTKEYNAFRADQFFNASTMDVGEDKIGPEIIEQMKETKVDIFVDFMGSGGSFIGVSKALKKKYPNVKCFGVEPDNASFYSSEEGSSGKHSIQGGGYNMQLNFVDKNQHVIDGFITVSDQEALNAAKLLASEECIFAGYSSGANLAAALKLLKGKFKGKNIVILTPDSGTKYLSTDLWSNV